MIFLIVAAIALFTGSPMVAVLAVALAFVFGNSSFLLGLAVPSMAWVYLCIITGFGTKAMARYPIFIAAILFGMFWAAGFTTMGVALALIALALGLVKYY